MDQRDLDLEHVLGILKRRALLVVLCIVVLAAAGYAYSKAQTKMYTASTGVTFKNNSLTEQIAGLNPLGTEDTFTQQEENLRLIETGDAAERAAEQIGDGLTAEDVNKSLSFGPEGESSGIKISAESSSPVEAAKIVNTYAKQFVKAQHRANREFFESALAQVKKQFAAMTPEQQAGSDGVDLAQRAHTLELLAQLGYNNAQVLQKASPPASPSSPKTKRNTAVGAFLGLILGLTLAFLLERLDRRVRDPEAFESIYGLPILGSVPSLPRRRRKGGYRTGPVSAETFNLIRAHLRTFNLDRELRTIMIVSPANGDGKTTVACGLAQATARSGVRTLLVEADLRRPAFAKELPEVREGPGLVDVLTDSVALDAAVQSPGALASSADSVGSQHRLEVLTAGAIPPNPSELLESGMMETLLGEAKTMYGLIVIDTPPLGAVSDAFPLLARVDGVIIVGRVGKSRRDAAEQLSAELIRSDAPSLGIIANEAKTRRPSYYDGGRSAPTALQPDPGNAMFEGPAPKGT